MKFPIVHEPEPPPPSLRMEEYLDFTSFILRMADPEKVRRQKEQEERIERRFFFPEDTETIYS